MLSWSTILMSRQAHKVRSSRVSTAEIAVKWSGGQDDLVRTGRTILDCKAGMLDVKMCCISICLYSLAQSLIQTDKGWYLITGMSVQTMSLKAASEIRLQPRLERSMSDNHHIVQPRKHVTTNVPRFAVATHAAMLCLVCRCKCGGVSADGQPERLHLARPPKTCAISPR